MKKLVKRFKEAESGYAAIMLILVLISMIPINYMANRNCKMVAIRIRLDQTAAMLDEYGYPISPELEKMRKQYASVGAFIFADARIQRDEEGLARLNQAVLIMARMDQIDGRLVEINQRGGELDAKCVEFHETYDQRPDDYRAHYDEYKAWREERARLDNESCMLLLERNELATQLQELEEQATLVNREALAA